MDLCRRSPHCQALALVGSFAQGRGDWISDLQPAAFVADCQAPAFLQQAEAVLMADEVLHACGAERPGVVSFKKVVYLDFSSCEFDAFALPTALQLRRPFVAAWDPQGLVETLVVDGPPPRHEEFDACPHGDDGLIWELEDCINWLQRGSTQLAKDYLHKLGMDSFAVTRLFPAKKFSA